MLPTVATLKTQDSAKQHFAETYGSALVWNTYLKIALLLVSLVAIGLLAMVNKALTMAATTKPFVIRVDEVGRAEVVNYTYTPQAPELRYFLTNFVVLHFSRQRANVTRDFPQSLFFLESNLSAAISDQSMSALEKFLKDPSADEIDIDVKNVRLSELTTPPFRAEVDFEQQFSVIGSRQIRKKELHTAQVVFRLSERVPNAQVKVNPLGLEITSFRVDQAF